MSTPSRKKNAELHPTEAVPRLALSIAEFCCAVGISVSSYGKMKRAGDGPRETRPWTNSNKILIAREDADAWLAQRRRAAEKQVSD